MAVSSKDRRDNAVDGLRRKRPSYSSKARRSCDFLTFHFDELPASRIPTITDRCGGMNIPKLVSQAEEYFHIIGKRLEINEEENQFEQIVSIMKQLKDNIVGIDGMDVIKVDDDDEKSHEEIVAYKLFDEFDTSKLYFMPIKILSQVDEEMKAILLDFFAFLVVKSPFLTIGESMEMTYSLGLDYFNNDGHSGDEINDYDTDKDSDELIQRYLDGDIREYFDEIWKKSRDCRLLTNCMTHDLLEKIKCYKKSGKAKDVEVSAILDLIVDGIRLNREDYLIDYDLRYIRMGYGDDTFLEEYGATDELIDIERQFMFCWDIDDNIAESVIDIFNADAGSLVQSELVQVIPISRVNKEITMDDYPLRWQKWYLNFIEKIQ